MRIAVADTDNAAACGIAVMAKASGTQGLVRP